MNSSEMGKKSWEIRKKKYGKKAIEMLKIAGKKGSKARWNKVKKLSTPPIVIPNVR